MKKAMIILNPSSGKEKALAYENKLREVLAEHFNATEVRKTEKEGDATHFATEACKCKFDAVFCLGGDGTVNEVINGLAQQDHRPKLGIIPLGTVNDFARALNIPLDPFEAISSFDGQTTRTVDVGKINHEYFVNVLAVGSIAEATYEVSVEQKTKLGSLAYFFEGVKAFLQDEAIELTIEHDKGTWNGEAFLLLTALTNSVGGFESLAPDAEVNDGKFHVFIIKEMSIPKAALMIPDLIRGELKENKHVDYIRTTTLTVSSKRQVVVNIDGEEGITLPFEAVVLPQHLHVFVPKLME